MIAIIVTAVLVVLVGFFAFVLIADAKYHAQGMALLVLACLIVIGGGASYPYVNKWQAEIAGEAQREKATSDAMTLRLMADALGGPDNYIRYLSATTGK